MFWYLTALKGEYNMALNMTAFRVFSDTSPSVYLCCLHTNNIQSQRLPFQTVERDCTATGVRLHYVLASHRDVTVFMTSHYVLSKVLV